MKMHLPDGTLRTCLSIHFILAAACSDSFSATNDGGLPDDASMSDDAKIDVDSDFPPVDLDEACVESLVEPEVGYVMARILRSYDSQRRLIDERLVDVDPRHVRDSPCFANPTGYGRFIHRWQYHGDALLRVRQVDLGDGTLCSAPAAPHGTETIWSRNVSGRPINRVDLAFKNEEWESIEETTYTYSDDDELLEILSLGIDRPRGTQTKFTYDEQGRLATMVVLLTNSSGDSFKDLTTWAYAGDVLSTKTTESSNSLQDDLGYLRREQLVYNTVQQVVEKRIDYRGEKPNTRADGVFDATTYFEYDGSSRIVSERLSYAFHTSLPKHTIDWTRDDLGRITREQLHNRSNYANLFPSAAFDASTSYHPYVDARWEYVGDSGRFSHVKLRDQQDTTTLDAQFEYETRAKEPRHVLTRRSDALMPGVAQIRDYEYDDEGRVARYRADINADGTWDEERLFDYRCGVDFTQGLGEKQPVTGPRLPTFDPVYPDFSAL